MVLGSQASVPQLQGINVSNSRVIEPRTIESIHLAIIENNLAKLKEILVQGVSTSFRYYDAEKNRLYSPLTLAVSRGSKECLIELLENIHSKGVVSLAEKVKDLGNVLHIAAAHRQASIAEFLLMPGRPKESLLKQRNERGYTPLMIAASLGDCPIIEIFVKKSFKILMQKDWNGKTALHHAAENSHEAACQLLISLGARVDAEDSQFRRPLDLVSDTRIRHLLTEAHKKLRDYEASPPNFYKYPPLNVCYKGGGAKGGVYLGVSECLNEEKINVQRFVGTSAGAIKATLDALNFDHQESFDILASIPARLLKDHLPGNILNKGALFKGDGFLKWMEEKIRLKTKKINFTFGELRAEIKNGAPYKHLYIYATKIQPTSEIVCFNSENKDWDCLPIAEAVRASISIPVAYAQHHLSFKDSSGELVSDPSGSIYCDGGVLKNLPVGAFDFQRYTRPGCSSLNQPEFNKRTLAFNIIESKKIEENTGVTDNVFMLLKNLLLVYLNSEKLHLRHQDYNNYRIVNVPDCGIKTMKFQLTDEERKKQNESGRRATRAFFAKEQLLAHLDDADIESANSLYEKEKQHIQAYLQTKNFLTQLFGYPNRKIYIHFFLEKLSADSGGSVDLIDFSTTRLPQKFLEEVLLYPDNLKIFLEYKIISALHLVSHLLNLLDHENKLEAEKFSEAYRDYFKDLFRSDERGFDQDYSVEAVEKLFVCNRSDHVEFFIDRAIITPHRALFCYIERKNLPGAEKLYQKYKNYFDNCTHPGFFKGLQAKNDVNRFFSEKTLTCQQEEIILDSEEMWQLLLHHLNASNKRAAETIFQKYKNFFRDVTPARVTGLCKKQVAFLLDQKILDPMICAAAGVHPLSQMIFSTKTPKEYLEEFIISMVVKFRSNNKDNWFENYQDFLRNFMGSYLLCKIHNHSKLVEFLIVKEVISFSTFLYAIMDRLNGYKDLEFTEPKAIYQTMKENYKRRTREEKNLIKEAITSYNSPEGELFFSEVL